MRACASSWGYNSGWPTARLRRVVYLGHRSRSRVLLRDDSKKKLAKSGFGKIPLKINRNILINNSTVNIFEL
jgi:hypothetical protein